MNMTDNYLIQFNLADLTNYSILKGDMNLKQILNNDIFCVLTDNRFTEDDILKKASDFDFLDNYKFNSGNIIIINKKEYSVNVYNDIFGYDAIYYNTDNDNVLLSNSLNLISGTKSEISTTAILDLILFHYLVLGNTPYKIVNRLKGGHKLTINKNTTEEIATKGLLNYFQDNFNPNIHTINNLSQFLKDEISSRINDKIPNFLTLTGGFDSRTLLSVVLQSNLDFETVTWGGTGNLQNIVSKEVSEQFDIEHQDIFLSKPFLDRISNYTEKVIKLNTDNPTILDLPQFVYMSETLPRSNVITGFMGSEIIRGPSVSSQTTLTFVASKLALCDSLDEFYIFVSNFLDELNLFNKEFLNQILPEYIKKFDHYFTKTSNTHKRALEFLFYEKYGSFYKSIINLHTGLNVINPYMNQDFITTVLNQKSSILNYPVFNTTAKDHFEFYKVYAQIIKSAYPKMLNTRVDRGYKIKHLTKFYHYPTLVYFHLKNHVMKRSKVKYAKPLDYPKWMKQMVLDNLQNSTLLDSDLFDIKSVENILAHFEKGQINDELMQKKLIILTGINLYNKFISS